MPLLTKSEAIKWLSDKEGLSLAQGKVVFRDAILRAACDANDIQVVEENDWNEIK